MLQVRIAWDPSLPTVASQAFTVGGRSFSDGEAFPWRELGVDEHTAENMWCSRMIDCVAQAAPEPAKPKRRSSKPTPQPAE